MAKEPDQTRWVGIRPTDPSEDIPTTTKKVPPAIADLQAISACVDEYVGVGGRDCTIEYHLPFCECPAGQLYIVRNFTAVNETTACDILLQARTTAITKPLRAYYGVAINHVVHWDGFIVMEEGDYLRGTYRLGGALDMVKVWMHGYAVCLY